MRAKANLVVRLACVRASRDSPGLQGSRPSDIFSEAQQAFQETLGDLHPATLMATNNVAMLLHKTHHHLRQTSRKINSHP